MRVGASLSRIAGCQICCDDTRIDVAAFNGPTAVTVAGVVSELEALAQTRSDRGVFNRLLRVEVPYNSHRMDPILGELSSVLAVLALHLP
ncbi:hypothetical protein [Mycobacterium persicum]|uniref:hypothetical protein n=1 Tax=Mycobacterium persicum TaxID=1487726 RepID=UPI000C0702F7|nr:hypothetical protein [Mycobacterium persicum]